MILETDGNGNGLSNPACISTNVGTPDQCDEGGLCPGSNGVPNIYGNYFQGLNSQSAGLFLTLQTDSVWNAPLPTGRRNVVSEQAKGYHGGEIDLGFISAINSFIADRTGAATGFFQDWRSRAGGFSFPGLGPVVSCSGRASQVMGPWKGALLSWLKTHPGQQPPPGIGSPASLPSCF